MKKLTAILAMATTALIFAACNNSESSETTATDSTVTTAGSDVTSATTTTTTNYVDLKTGTTVTMDPATGMWVTVSGEPAEFYVDMNTMDTFYGKTNQNVDNALIHEGDIWRVDESKIKVDDDGIKIKDSDGTKTKIGEDESKVKDANGKWKEEDGQQKVKDAGGKMKTN